MTEIVACRLFSAFWRCIFTVLSLWPGSWAAYGNLDVTAWSVALDGVNWSLQIEQEEGELFSFCMEYDGFCWKIICEN